MTRGARQRGARHAEPKARNVASTADFRVRAGRARRGACDFALASPVTGGPRIEPRAPAEPARRPGSEPLTGDRQGARLWRAVHTIEARPHIIIRTVQRAAGEIDGDLAIHVHLIGSALMVVTLAMGCSVRGGV